MRQLATERPKTEFIGTHVDTLTRAELIALARERDRSLSWILRRALQTYLERSGEPKEAA